MSKSELIRGAGGGGKSGGGSGRVAKEAPDSLRSRQIARVVDLVSEGEIEGLVNGLQSVYLDDTPVKNPDGTYNFDGVSLTVRHGTQDQEYIPDIPAVESEQGVGVEIEYATPVVRSISSSSVDSARVTVSVPQLTKQNVTNGDINGTRVRIAIDVQNDGGGYVAQAIGTDTLNLAVNDDEATSAPNEILSANLEVSWVGSASSQSNGYYYIGAPFRGVYQSIAWRLDYRVVGGSTWTPLQSGSFSGTSYREAQNIGVSINYVTRAPSGTKTVLFQPDDVDQYEFRVVKTSGTGTLSLDGDASGPVTYDDISGKTSSKYQRAYRIPLPGSGPWDIRLRRLTADSTSQALQNKTFWDSYTEIIDEKLAYPNSALMALSIDSERFSSIPVRGYEIKGVKVQIPSNYDPITREYDGTWDGTFQTAWTDNPAWIFYDMVVNSRYGCGEFIDASLVDKWALYSIAQYCDELVPDGLGGEEPRYQCNIYLQTREDAYRVLESLASVFNAVTFWSSGAIVPVQDSPKDPVAIFTAANVIDGQFSYSGSSMKTRSTVALVTWNDPDDRYRQAVEYVEDRTGVLRYGVRQKEVTAIGCTSRGQAHRFGKAILYSERQETETVTFTAGLDGLSISPGEVIQTSDPSRAGQRMGGRVQSATTTAVTLDQTITLDPDETYTLWCVMPDGSVESRAVTSTGETNVMNVASAFSDTPKDWSVWVLAASNLELESWRVVSITESDNATAQITALEYRADKYDAIENDVVLQPKITSSLNASVQAPVTNLNISEELYLITAATVGTKINVSWTGSGSFYEVAWRPSEGNFQTITTSSTSIEIQPVVAGEYEIKVTAVNAVGVRSPANSKIIEVYGLTAPPADVDEFALEAITGNAHLSFAASDDLDVKVGGHLRVRHSKLTSGASWSSAVNIGPKIPGNSTNAVLPLLSGTYLAKWVDASGNESVNAVSITTNAASIIKLNLVDQIQEDTEFAGTHDGTATSTFGATPAVILAGDTLWDDIEGYINDWGEIDTWPQINTSGYYYFANNVDLGQSFVSKLSASINATSYRMGVYFDDIEGLIDDLEQKWDGDDVSSSDVTLEVRTTDDDPSGSPTWSSWSELRAGDYQARAYEFRAHLSTLNTNTGMALIECGVTVDMPDRLQSGDDITATTSGKTITYDDEFYINPAVGITAQGLQTGDFHEFTSKDKTGFTIIFKNASGTAIERTFDYIARGY